MNRHQAKAAVVAVRGLTVEDFRAWPVAGGVWLVEERDAVLRENGLVWAVSPDGRVRMGRPDAMSVTDDDRSEFQSTSNSVADEGLERLATIFPELASSHLHIKSPRLDDVAVTAYHKSWLRRIRRYSRAESLSSLMDLTIGDILSWPGVGKQNIEGILTYLDRVRRSPGLKDTNAGETAVPTASTTTQTLDARVEGRSISDALTGQLGDVFPPLHLLADVELQSEWLDEVAGSSGSALALAALRASAKDGATVGDILSMDAYSTSKGQGTYRFAGGLVFDFMARLAECAQESRDSAIETVSSWIESSTGSRATWSAIAGLDSESMPIEVQRAWETLASMPIATRTDS